MTNADKFKHLFGIYATELWAMPESDFLEWLNADAQDMPTGKWIPCSERLPDNDDFVIVTILDERGDTPYRYSDFGWYFDRAKCWIIDAEERTDVIAWMPLPTPYIVG